MSTYMISDLHLGDKHYLKKFHEKYGIKLSPKQHCDILIRHCNELVRKGDTLYILGDVTTGYVNSEMFKFFRRVKGMKILIGGNHDNDCVTRILRKYGFIQAMYGCFELEGFVLTHIPITETEIIGVDGRYYKCNIHGHIHDDFKQQSLNPKLYYNVCANMNGFYPTLFDNIKKRYNESSTD